jgi:hypothetical protein
MKETGVLWIVIGVVMCALVAAVTLTFIVYNYQYYAR